MEPEMKKLTKEQQQALKRVYDRGADTNPPTYLQFRRQAVMMAYDDCVLIQWAGMWLGIEPNGYTHS
jgi:hypothetical protein